MPIQVSIDHFNRLVVGVGHGPLSIKDLVAFGLETLQAGAVSYGKIIDVANVTPDFSEQELLAFAQVVRATRPEMRRGPVALVIDPLKGERAKLFAGLELGDRPARVFRSIHEARRWMSAHMQERQRADDDR